MSSAAPMQQANTKVTEKAARQTNQLVAQNQQIGTSEFTDLRSQARTQRQQQEAANHSSQSGQLKAFQQMAKDSSRAIQLKSLVAMKNAPAVQRMEEEQALQAKTEGATFQRETAADAAEISEPNNTGLPDNLKSGIESLSGMSMDHVKVHYNSSQPAQLNAHAYAQGSDIHLAPGQEQHLPHEAWHVVQQAQGRVKPTMQMKSGMAVNDDVGLETEADVMGAKALSYAPIQLSNQYQSTQARTSPKSDQVMRSNVTQGQMILSRSIQSGVIQRSSLKETSADGPFDSPFKVLQTALPGVNLFLSSVNTTSNSDPCATSTTYKRPKQVDAVIKGARRPTGGRPASAMPAAVGNLGNQELLIRNGIRQQTYEGGHLIGDELLPTTIDSMVDWNLAPQNANFNHPVYFGLAEELIFAGITNQKTGQSDKNIPIDVKVTLGYPSSNFSVTVQELITNSVISANDQALKSVSLNKVITFTSRVPNSWVISAKPGKSSTSSGTFPLHELTNLQKGAFNSNNDLNESLGLTDFLVSSPDLQTINGKTMIGGGNSLTLNGIQGDTDPSNLNPSRSGVIPTISAPVFVPQPIFSGNQGDINVVMSENDGEFSQQMIQSLLAIKGVSKTHVNKLHSAAKRCFTDRVYKGGIQKKKHKKKTRYKVFSDRDDFLRVVLKDKVFNTKNGKILKQRLLLDGSLKFNI